MRHLIFALCLFYLGCGPTAFYEQAYSFENGSWSYEDAKAFSFTAPDTISKYDLILDLTHTEDYAYENLYVQLNTRFPNEDEVTDEISIPLIREDGQWVGKGSSEKRVRVYLQQALRFKHIGEHTITLKQYSREEQLAGVNAISLVIYPVEN